MGCTVLFGLLLGGVHNSALAFGLSHWLVLANRWFTGMKQAEAWNVFVWLDLLSCHHHEKHITQIICWFTEGWETYRADLDLTCNLEPSPAYPSHHQAQTQKWESLIVVLTHGVGRGVVTQHYWGNCSLTQRLKIKSIKRVHQTITTGINYKMVSFLIRKPSLTITNFKPTEMHSCLPGGPHFVMLSTCLVSWKHSLKLNFWNLTVCQEIPKC